jgi:hypothetical protein
MIDWLPILLLILGVSLGALALLSILRRRLDPGAIASRKLLAAAKLDRQQSHLLRRMADAADLPNTGCLLLSRGCFDHAANTAAARGIVLYRAELAALEQRLFDGINAAD